MNPNDSPGHQRKQTSSNALSTLALLLSLAMLSAGCSVEPTTPTNENHAPTVSSITVSGSRPVIAAGSINLLIQAESSDIDGDDMNFAWSGDGIFHDQDDIAKTVRWDIPTGTYGILQVTCTVSDGTEEGSRTQSIDVGRSLSISDYGDLVGNTVTWSLDDAPFYILEGTVIIPDGIVLHVNEGVTIWCDRDRTLLVNGSLEVDGNHNQKVAFKAYAEESEEKDYWGGIVFESSDGLVDMSWCNLLNAGTSVSMPLGSGNGAVFENCEFNHCQAGISANSAEMVARFCVVDNATIGFNLTASNVEIEGCQFFNTVDPAIQIVNGSEGSCVSSRFLDNSPPAISISGGSYVSFHENRIYGEAVAILVGGSYGADPTPLDGQCNYWGVDGMTAQDIEGRIQNQGWQSPEFTFSPWQVNLEGECEDVNHPPLVVSISVSGNRPVVAAGTINLLVQAETADIDGDALSFTWSGDGHFHDQDDLAKTVRWDVPAGSYGDLSVTCTVSDGSEEGTRTRSFEVGRSLSAADYGDLVGQTVTWSTEDAPFYILQGDVTIPTGITLRVEESVTVWCDSGRDIKINGSLVVAGDSHGKVNFKAYAPDTDEKDYWDGIVFESGDGSIDMSWCNIDNAGTSVSMALGSGTGALIENCGFFNCLTAISANFSDLTVRFCTVSNATKGFNLAGSEVEIEGCQFLDTLDPALQIVGATEGSCIGSHFTDFSPPAIAISGGSYVTFHDNRFYGDELAVLVGGSYGADPEPIDGRCNYWGEGATEASIAARIENQGTGSPEFLYSPWRATIGAECTPPEKSRGD